MTAPILVTGGTGRLGQRVVSRLAQAGYDVRVFARHECVIPPQAAFFQGDLRTGAGIDAAMSDVGTVIHCATSTKGDAEATRNLLASAARANSPHFVQPSIVGIDRAATWAYMKTKLEVERIVENSGLRWTIVRITQFFDYCFENSRMLAKFPVLAPVPAGFIVQPVDPDEAADRIVELALEKLAGHAPDVAGPEVTSWDSLFRSYLRATRRRPWVVPVRIPGSKAVRNGALLPSPGYTAGIKTWDQFLTSRLQQPFATSPDQTRQRR